MKRGNWPDRRKVADDVTRAETPGPEMMKSVWGEEKYVDIVYLNYHTSGRGTVDMCM